MCGPLMVVLVVACRLISPRSRGRPTTGRSSTRPCCTRPKRRSPIIAPSLRHACSVSPSSALQKQPSPQPGPTSFGCLGRNAYFQEHIPKGQQAGSESRFDCTLLSSAPNSPLEMANMASEPVRPHYMAFISAPQHSSSHVASLPAFPARTHMPPYASRVVLSHALRPSPTSCLWSSRSPRRAPSSPSSGLFSSDS